MQCKTMPMTLCTGMHDFTLLKGAVGVAGAQMFFHPQRRRLRTDSWDWSLHTLQTGQTGVTQRQVCQLLQALPGLPWPSGPEPASCSHQPPEQTPRSWIARREQIPQRASEQASELWLSRVRVRRVCPGQKNTHMPWNAAHGGHDVRPLPTALTQV